MKTVVPTRVLMAYGEAGCAIVARAFGLEVSCKPSDGGVPTMDGVSATCFIPRDADMATRISALAKDAKVMLARHAAIMRADPRLAEKFEDHPDATIVWTVALHIAMLRAGKDALLALERNDQAAEVYADEADEVFTQLMAETTSLCDERWPAIERTAAVLLGCCHLDTAEVDRLLHASMH